MYLLEGIVKYLREAARFAPPPVEPEEVRAAIFDKTPESILFRYCTEALLEGDAIDRDALRREVALLGDSIVLAGGASRVRLHVHTNEPEKLFSVAARFARRFEARIDDRLRQWKLSPIDLPSRERWYDYSRARDMMLEATDTDFAPWYIVRSDDKKRARLNVLSHFLSLIPYEAPKRDKIKLPARDNNNAYDDEATIKDRRSIKEKF